MTKIAISPNVNGTGTFTIAAPNSNTDRTLTLPDAGGEVAVFAAGTKMLFAQTTAPTGWTKDTTHNNKALRVVSGTAGSGGSLDFTTAFGNRTTGSTAAGGTVAAHTLSLAQIPGHNHRVDHAAALATFGGFGGTRFYNRVIDTFVINNQQPDRATSVEGGGQAHTHGFTGASHAHGLDMQVQFVDIIIATKA